MKYTLLILLIASFAKAEVNSSVATADTSNRMKNKIGITTGFGNPFPSILGMNLNYNVADFVRATIGYGEVSVSSGESNASVKTIGGGADVFVPGWSFTPTVGLRVSKVDVSASGGGSLSVQGIEESGTLTYAQAGFDWQSAGGFNLGAGAIAGLAGPKASGSYFSFGWYF